MVCLELGLHEETLPELQQGFGCAKPTSVSRRPQRTLRCLKNFPLCLDSEFFHCFLEPLWLGSGPASCEHPVEMNQTVKMVDIRHPDLGDGLTHAMRIECEEYHAVEKSLGKS